MSLFDSSCVDVSTIEKCLDDSSIENYISKLDKQWEIVGGKKIRHGFMFPDFKKLMEFVNKIADVAEAEGHHPDMHIFYNKLVIELYTHSLDGLTENDFIIASKIEKLI